MGSKIYINCNPSMLKWVRESSGYSKKDIVKKLKRKTITEETLVNWENGKSFPTYSQLDRLAYNIYKRSLVVFFFAKPPDESKIKKSFRTIEINNITPKVRILIRKAYAFQLKIKELLNKDDSHERKIFKDIIFKKDSSIQKIAQDVREYLNINLEKQFFWKTEDEALKHWRDAIENSGIYVFKDSFKEDNCSGFCLYDDNVPIIYINNNHSKTRQIFTLFHELAHVLFNTSGLDLLEDFESKNTITETSDRIEIMCNEFSGTFLVPENSLPNKKDFQLKDIELKKYYKKYHVSEEVFVRRLLENKIINQKEYQEYRKKLENNLKPALSKKKQKGRGNYYANKETYLGKKYLSLVFKNYKEKKITHDQLSDLIEVKLNRTHRFEPN